MERILVSEASSLGAIGVIRSLGKSGYDVYACSTKRDALGFRSRYCTVGLSHPDYYSVEFLPWLFNVVEEYRIQAVVPSESFLLAVQSVYKDLEYLFPIGPNKETVYGCLSKVWVHEKLLVSSERNSLQDNLPKTIVWREGRALPSGDSLSRLGFPLFIKADGIFSLNRAGGTVRRAEELSMALSILDELSGLYRALIIQGYVPGKRMVADFCVWDGKIKSRSMMISRHEDPHYGGIATLRKMTWNEQVMADAERKAAHLGIQGVAMMEYRVDPKTGKFYFIEVNSRYWLGIHVEIMMGIDIPKIHMNAFFGRESPYVENKRESSWVRYTFPGDVGWLISRLKDGKLTLGEKLKTVVEFLWLGIDIRVKSDLSYRGDRMLYWLALKRFVLGFFWKG
jgi:predicted ATP-grasp superfamily ATP-dependent carboligase